jgi:hypothetical protein
MLDVSRALSHSPRRGRMTHGRCAYPPSCGTAGRKGLVNLLDDAAERRGEEAAADIGPLRKVALARDAGTSAGVNPGAGTSPTPPDAGQPRAFLCHAVEDHPRMRELYRRLRADGFFVLNRNRRHRVSVRRLPVGSPASRPAEGLGHGAGGWARWRAQQYKQFLTKTSAAPFGGWRSTSGCIVRQRGQLVAEGCARGPGIGRAGSACRRSHRRGKNLPSDRNLERSLS